MDASRSRESFLHEPYPRWGHNALYANENVYLWGGTSSFPLKTHDGPQKQQYMSQISVFDTVTCRWGLKIASGPAPLGVRDFSAVVQSTDRLVQFGGYCGHGHCWHNSLHTLYVNCERLQWEELSCDLPDDCKDVPLMKQDCGMVCYDDVDGCPVLCVFGGAGQLRTAASGHISNWESTNELHIFKFSDNKWQLPKVAGHSPPPCHGFSFVKMNAHKVLLFGGNVGRTENSAPSDQLYSLSLGDVMTWTPIVASLERPKCRVNHASLMAGNNLLVIGGFNSEDKTTNDIWSFNVNTKTWTQVIEGFPLFLCCRASHTVTPCEVKADGTLMSFVTFGGLTDFIKGEDHSKQPMLSHTATANIKLTDNQSLVSVDYCDDLSYMGRQLKAVSDKYIMEIADKDKEIKFLQNQLKGFRSKIENMERYFEDTRQTLQDLSTQTSYQSESDTDDRDKSLSEAISPSAETKLFVEAIDEIVEWYPLGMALGLQSATLRKIEVECDGILMRKIKVIESWLNGMDDCRDRTWSGLASAVAGPFVKNNTLAEEIKKKYINF